MKYITMFVCSCFVADGNRTSQTKCKEKREISEVELRNIAIAADGLSWSLEDRPPLCDIKISTSLDELAFNEGNVL